GQPALVRMPAHELRDLGAVEDAFLLERVGDLLAPLRVGDRAEVEFADDLLFRSDLQGDDQLVGHEGGDPERRVLGAHLGRGLVADRLQRDLDPGEELGDPRLDHDVAARIDFGGFVLEQELGLHEGSPDFREGGGQARTTTISRYSLGTTSEPGAAVLSRSSRASRSASSAFWPAVESVPKALWVGPYQSRNTCTKWAAER